MSRHFRRAVVPALISSAAAGLAWWIVIALEMTIANEPRRPNLLDIPRSLALFEVATFVPNWVGLAVLSRWFARRRGWSLTLVRVWPLLGFGYGLTMLVVGGATGITVILGPAWLFMSAVIRELPRFDSLIVSILTVTELYPVAAIGGLVAVACLIRGEAPTP